MVGGDKGKKQCEETRRKENKARVITLFYFLLPEPVAITGEGRVQDYDAVAAGCRTEDVYNEQV